MIYNRQSDAKWYDMQMAMKGDTLGLYGCLVTAIANIFEILPSTLNLLLRENKGYMGLVDAKTWVNKESFINWPVVESLLKFKHYVINPDQIKFDDKTFIIACIKHRKYRTNHYCNLLDYSDEKYKIFDTDYGDIKLYDRVVSLIKIVKD